MVQISIDGEKRELDGSRVLTEAEFNILRGYVGHYLDEIGRLKSKKEEFVALEKKLAEISSVDGLSESDLEKLVLLADCEACRLHEKMDENLRRIGEIRAVCSEATGGGYELYKKRWMAD